MRSSSTRPVAARLSRTTDSLSAATRRSARDAHARDVTELLDRMGLSRAGAAPSAVAYHDACSLQHAQRVDRAPRQLLARAGFEVMDVPERHFCCGSAGTYNMLQPEIAATLGERKAVHIESVAADIVAAGNLGYMMQIGRLAQTPVVRTVELLRSGDRRAAPPALTGALARTGAAKARARDERTAHRQPPIRIPPPSGDPTGRAQRGASMTSANLEAFFAAIAGALGADGVNRSEETIRRYGENTMPGGDRPPAGVVYPGSTADVQADRAGGQHAQGGALSDQHRQQYGLGSRSASAPARSWSISAARYRILDIDEKLAFAVVEPGVSYQALYDELVRRGNK